MISTVIQNELLFLNCSPFHVCAVFEEILFHTFLICVFSEHFEATTVFIFVEHGYHGYRCSSHLLQGGKSSVCSNTHIHTNTQCQHSDLQWYKRLTLVSEIQLLFWNTLLTFSVLLCGTKRERQKYLIMEEKSRGDSEGLWDRSSD